MQIAVLLTSRTVLVLILRQAHLLTAAQALCSIPGPSEHLQIEKAMRQRSQKILGRYLPNLMRVEEQILMHMHKKEIYVVPLKG